MNGEMVEGGSTSLMRHQLETARQSWMRGEWMDARDGAQKALTAAVACRDPHLEGRASLLLAQVLTLQSRFGWARRFGERARHLFENESDPRGLSEAMLSLSYVDSALGQEDLAVRGAEAVVAGTDGIARRGAAGLNYRGVAASWGGQYGTARGMLDAACELAPDEAGCRSAVFHPLANAIFTEVLRCARMRMAGHRVDLSELARLVAREWELVKAGATGSLAEISADPGLFLLEFASCFLATRTGDAARADQHYLGCLERAARLPPTSWMHALVWWARLERSLAAGDAKEIGVSAARLASAARASEHAPLKALARSLAAEAREYLARAPREAVSWF